MLRRLAPVCLATIPFLVVACGDDGATGAGGSNDTGSGSSKASSSASGLGGGGGEPEVCFSPPQDPAAPLAADVSLAAVSGLLEGEQILFNDWNAAPNEILAMRPDGTEETVVLRAYRVWSFGVSRSGNKIALSVGDPMQEEHFGVTVGDAIQPTFVYDFSCGTFGALTWGNLNDECHAFGPGDDWLYLCRRYDFTSTGESKGYAVGRAHLESAAFEWLTTDDPMLHTLSPQPTADESEIIYYRIPVPGTASVVRRPMAGGTEVTVRERIGYPRLSPDGTRLLVADFEQMGALVSVDLAGGSQILVAEGESLTTATWSPDGSRVAFLRYDDAGACSHVEVAAADGSQASAPARIHDCLDTGRFVTELAWIDR